jgi:hypothetical protein
MNFKQTFFFINKKLKKYENLSVFYTSLTVTYYYKKFDHQRNCIMKTKGPMKLKLNNGDYIGHPNMLPLPKGLWPQVAH